MQEETIEITRDGIKLHGIVTVPDGHKNNEKLPLLLICHGFGGDLGYESDSVYKKISDLAIGEGYMTLRFDFDGHGKSGGSMEFMDLFREVLDGIEIIRYAQHREDVDKITLLGHSQGGVVASVLAGLYADVIDGLVLLAAAASLQDDAREGICFGTKYDTDHIPEYVTVDNGRHKLGGHYFRIAKYFPIYELAAHFRGRALIIQGTEDSIVRPGVAQKFAATLTGSRLLLVDDLDHALEGAGQAKMLAEIGKFLKSGSSSPADSSHPADRIQGTEGNNETLHPQAEETILNIHVKLDGHYEVGKYRMLPFHGYAESPYFHGTILPGGVDTQRQAGNTLYLSARYILEGIDSAGNKCRIFIENTGIDNGIDDLYTIPTMVTDSPVLQRFSATPLRGTIEPDPAGLLIRIFTLLGSS